MKTIRVLFYKLVSVHQTPHETFRGRASPEQKDKRKRESHRCGKDRRKFPETLSDSIRVPTPLHVSISMLSNLESKLLTTSGL